MRDYVQIPTNLYVHKEAHDRMANEGAEEIGYVQVGDQENYVLIDKAAFQPGIQLDENSYQVTYIFK